MRSVKPSLASHDRPPKNYRTMERLISLFGLFFIPFLAWLLSENRWKMNFRLILSGTAMQFVMAFFLLKTPWGEKCFEGARVFIGTIVDFAFVGPRWLFSDALIKECAILQLVPPIIFVASLMAVLFHLGIMQVIVKWMATIMVRVMDSSGSESLCAAANVFLGMAEAPLAIRPYLETMTRSEIMAMMTSGLATIAGGVMASYVKMGVDAGHLLAASLMSAPAAIVLAKIMVPESEQSPTLGVVKIDIPKLDSNAFDAACRGASEGMTLSLNMTAGLIAILGLVALVNWPMSKAIIGGEALSMERISGWIMSPLAWTMGVSWNDCHAVGSLLGKRLVFNEFLAYRDMVVLKETISPRSFVITTYAMCGFANFGSVAIMIGGIGSLVPSRRHELASLGMKSLVAGTLASFMTAAIAGILC